MIFRVLIILFLSNQVYAKPNIVVSINPVYLIVSELVQDVANVQLLLKTNESAHHSNLKLSQLDKITNADLVISVHPEFEHGFTKIFQNINSNKKIFVSNSSFNNHHLWLDISYVQKFVQKLSKKLIQIDKNNENIYKKNLTKLNTKLTKLENNIKQRLTPYKNVNIAIFSDAFMHFISANNLQKPIKVTNHHDDKLSIYKILKARENMKKSNTKCLLSTNEISAKIIKTLTNDLTINTASADIIGLNNNANYFELMQNLTNKVIKCLK